MQNDYNISLLSFKILNEKGKEINYITTQKNELTPVTINCTIYIPNEERDMIIENSKKYPHMAYRIYSSATYHSRNIAMLSITIPIDKIKSNNFMNLSFSFDVPYELPNFDDEIMKVKNCNFTLAISQKSLGEMGFSESIRVGTFLKTTIPIIEE